MQTITSLSASIKLHHTVLYHCHTERSLSVDFGGTAPSLCDFHISRELSNAEHPPQTQLCPIGLAEDKIEERVQADVENGHHHGQLFQVVESLAPLVFQEGVGKANQVVWHKANTEDSDQHQHVPAGLGEIL